MDICGTITSGRGLNISTIQYDHSGFNPFGLDETRQMMTEITTAIAFTPLFLIQLPSVVATVATAVTIFQQRKIGGASNITKSRTTGAVKVLVTNIPSLMYVLFMGTPLFMIIQFGTSGEIISETSGWIGFYAAVMFPLLSSVWNPIVFIALTPKSRTSLRSLFVTQGGAATTRNN